MALEQLPVTEGGSSRRRPLFRDLVNKLGGPTRLIESLSQGNSFADTAVQLDDEPSGVENFVQDLLDPVLPDDFRSDPSSSRFADVANAVLPFVGGEGDVRNFRVPTKEDFQNTLIGSVLSGKGIPDSGPIPNGENVVASSATVPFVGGSARLVANLGRGAVSGGRKLAAKNLLQALEQNSIRPATSPAARSFVAPKVAPTIGQSSIAGPTITAAFPAQAATSAAPAAAGAASAISKPGVAKRLLKALGGTLGVGGALAVVNELFKGDKVSDQGLSDLVTEGTGGAEGVGEAEDTEQQVLPGFDENPEILSDDVLSILEPSGLPEPQAPQEEQDPLLSQFQQVLSQLRDSQLPPLEVPQVEKKPGFRGFLQKVGNFSSDVADAAQGRFDPLKRQKENLSLTAATDDINRRRQSLNPIDASTLQLLQNLVQARSNIAASGEEQERIAKISGQVRSQESLADFRRQLLRDEIQADRQQEREGPLTKQAAALQLEALRQQRFLEFQKRIEALLPASLRGRLGGSGDSEPQIDFGPDGG